MGRKRNLREKAKEVLTLSPLMNGREKIKTKELIKKYPDGVHMIAADIVAPEKEGDKPYAVILFKENEKEYYCGGLILSKIVAGMLEECDGDFSVLNGELSADPIGIKLTMSETKDDNNITLIEVLDN